MGKEKDYREQIDRSVKRLAKALNLIEAMRDELQFVFEQTEWNDEVKYQIDEAAAKVGFSLATLSTWYDDAEE